MFEFDLTFSMHNTGPCDPLAAMDKILAETRQNNNNSNAQIQHRTEALDTTKGRKIYFFVSTI